jgi:hypothetical protein
MADSVFIINGILLIWGFMVLLGEFMEEVLVLLIVGDYI